MGEIEVIREKLRAAQTAVTNIFYRHGDTSATYQRAQAELSAALSALESIEQRLDPRCDHCNGSPAIGSKDKCQWCSGTGLKEARRVHGGLIACASTNRGATLSAEEVQWVVSALERLEQPTPPAECGCREALDHGTVRLTAEIDAARPSSGDGGGGEVERGGSRPA